ncbi:MAG: RNA polymerase sigma factor, partial [Phycisphaeraceae bacterium]
LIEALRSLPEAMRWTLLLVDVEQLEHAGPAEVLGVPEGTIKSRAHRGRQMLRKRLAEEAKARGWVDRPQKEVTP